MNSSTRAPEVLSADDKKLQNCNIVYGVHPHTIYLIIAVFAAAAIASFFIGFCVSRCCVSLKRRRRKKLFSSGGEGPSLSSPSFRRSVTRSSQRDRSNHSRRASAVGLLRTADELRQHNPNSSTLTRPFTFHEMSDDHSGGLSGIVFMSDFNTAPSSRDNINHHNGMQAAPEFSVVTKPPRSVIPTRPLGPRVSLQDINSSSVVLRRNNTPVYDESRLAARRMSSYGDLKNSGGNLTRISERSSDVSKESAAAAAVKNLSLREMKSKPDKSTDSLPSAPERIDSLNKSPNPEVVAK